MLFRYRTSAMLVSLMLVAGWAVRATVSGGTLADDRQVFAQNGADNLTNGVHEKRRESSEPVAIVELFTSEGCSSCPPADRNLQRIADSDNGRELRVIPLSFHVDYWNYLGWKDPYSQTNFSERQQQYAASADDGNRVYTPQMIINGRYSINGSNEALADKAIQLSLQQKVNHLVVLKLSAAKPIDDGKSIRIEFDSNTENGIAIDETDYVLNVAVARDKETMKVSSKSCCGVL